MSMRARKKKMSQDTTTIDRELRGGELGSRSFRGKERSAHLRNLRDEVASEDSVSVIRGVNQV